MSTTAIELLGIMKLRLTMYESGFIQPQSTAVAATRELVERLASLPPNEEVEISYTIKPLHAQYIRVRTNEVLAELQEKHAI